MHFPMMEISNGKIVEIIVLAREGSSIKNGDKKSQETSRHVIVL